ncbi:MAG: hypothetical protein AB9866_08545 [Syntrophobacteraceae bacterium]
MKTCSRCMLPENYRAISYDEYDVCNYCRTYDELRPRLEDFDHLGKLFQECIDGARGKAEYDALVGISGGKDSSYLVYSLKANYGLKILTVTVDNGFLTDFARKSLERVVQSLGVDHFFHTPQWSMFRECYRATTRTRGLPCLACGQVGYASLYKLALERGIPLAIHGRTRAQMFRDLTAGSKDPVIPCISSNLAPPDPQNIRTLGSRITEQIDSFLDQIFVGKEERAPAQREFGIDEEQFRNAACVPDWIAYFLYHPYDEEALKRTLEEKTAWQRPEHDVSLGHYDCFIHDAAEYLCHHSLGSSLLAIELSTAVRIGEMTREQAQARLLEERCIQEYPEASMKVLQDRLGITTAEIEPIIREARERHRRLQMELREANLITTTRSLEL